MPRLNEIPKGSSVIMLVYGPSRAGKTEFCGTAGSKALWINTGLGIATLQSPGFRKRHPNVNPIIETVTDEINPKDPVGYDKVCDLLDDYLRPEHPEYNNFDTVIVDDVTDLRRFAIDKGIKNNFETNLSQTYKQRQAGKIVTVVQDYGAEMNLIDQFMIYYIQLCRNYNKHLIITAHERVEHNKPARIGDIPTVHSIRPGFTGQTFPDSVTGKFDLVWYFEKQGGGERINYYARTVGDSSLMAGGRYDGLFPERVKDPNFLDVVNKIRNS